MMTFGDFYDVVTFFAMLGTVAMVAGWVILHGPAWYRRKRAAAIEFHREARIREQAPTNLVEAFQQVAKTYERVFVEVGDAIAKPFVGPRGTVKNPADPSPRRAR